MCIMEERLEKKSGDIRGIRMELGMVNGFKRVL